MHTFCNYSSFQIKLYRSSFQEIGLKRENPVERLGLTLCYEDDDEEGKTEIFIDDIHPEGLAAKDGRLRLGDQIIQVNLIAIMIPNTLEEL